MVCFHDDCYTLLTALAREYGLKVPFRPIHIFEYLYRGMLKRKDRIRKIPLKAACQSPCASRYTQGKDIYLASSLNSSAWSSPSASTSGPTPCAAAPR